MRKVLPPPLEEFRTSAHTSQPYAGSPVLLFLAHILTFISEVGPLLILHGYLSQTLSLSLYGVPFPLFHSLCLCLIVGILSGFVMFALPAFGSKGW